MNSLHILRNFNSTTLARFLIKQNCAPLLIFHVDVKGRFHLDGQTAFNRWTRQQSFEPALDVGKSAHVVAVALGPARPTDASDIGDRIIASEKLAVLEPRVHDAVDSVHLVAEALEGMRQSLGRIMSDGLRSYRPRAE